MSVHKKLFLKKQLYHLLLHKHSCYLSVSFPFFPYYNIKSLNIIEPELVETVSRIKIDLKILKPVFNRHLNIADTFFRVPMTFTISKFHCSSISLHCAI